MVVAIVGRLVQSVAAFLGALRGFGTSLTREREVEIETRDWRFVWKDRTCREPVTSRTASTPDSTGDRPLLASDEGASEGVSPPERGQARGEMAEAPNVDYDGGTQ